MSLTPAGTTPASRQAITKESIRSLNSIIDDKKVPKATLHAFTLKRGKQEYYGLCHTEYVKGSLNKTRAIKEKRLKERRAAAAAAALSKATAVDSPSDAATALPTAIFSRIDIRRVSRRISSASIDVSALSGSVKNFFSRGM